MYEFDYSDYDEESSDSEEQSPSTSNRKVIILWLVAFSLMLSVVPFYLVSLTFRTDIARAGSRLEQAQQALTVVPSPDAEIETLMADLAEIKQASDTISQTYPTLVAGHTDWRTVMERIGNYNPTQITLNSLSQADSRIVLAGQASDDSVVIAYTRNLKESGLFADVILESMTVIATPYVTSTATALPATAATSVPTTSATATPTPGLRDKFEVDDFDPKPIFIDQPQQHNFYPVYDIDSVCFLAKSGRYYRVTTGELSPGVDTVVAVKVAGVTYTNDDRQPGELNSEVLFRVEGPDVTAIVEITNRGEYGPDMRYEVTVEEVLPTPTPTGVPTPVPTATQTPGPTHTPAPTATPTEALADVYEPDQPTPRAIALGETQAHNFYPTNDVDAVAFLAKAGRRYTVSTSELALGVDTLLVVTVGSAVYTNDDRTTGDLSSAVTFDAGSSDVDVVVRVENRGLFGSQRWYYLTVEEVVPTPTPSVAPPSSSAGMGGDCAGLDDGGNQAERAPVGMRKPVVACELFRPLADAVEFVIILELKGGTP